MFKLAVGGDGLAEWGGRLLQKSYNPEAYVASAVTLSFFRHSRWKHFETG